MTIFGFNKAFVGYGRKRSHFPMGGYLSVMSIYGFLVTLLVSREKPAGRADSILDQVFLGIGTHKLSRIITKDIVTAPIRSPFTRYRELLGYGEVEESGRGKGVREVLGDLLSCSYCADPWVALGLSYGMKISPAKTRYLLRLLSAIALADFLHVFYETTRSRENVLTLREKVLERESEGRTERDGKAA